MIFITDQLYLSLHWSGDTDFEDTRIWIQKVIDDEKAEPVLVYNSFEMASFTHRYIFVLKRLHCIHGIFPRKLVYFACQKTEASYRLGEDFSTKWALIRYYYV